MTQKRLFFPLLWYDCGTYTKKRAKYAHRKNVLLACEWQNEREKERQSFNHELQNDIWPSMTSKITTMVAPLVRFHSFTSLVVLTVIIIELYFHTPSSCFIFFDSVNEGVCCGENELSSGSWKRATKQPHPKTI